MEVVLGVVVLSHVCIGLYDRLMSKRHSGTDNAFSAPTSSPPPAEAGTPAARIRELESELAKLKEEARDASGPDNFIRYARITRKQKKVEEELTDLRGDEAPTLPILELMGAFMPQRSVAADAKSRAVRAVLSALPLITLWAYFRFATNSNPGAVVTVDCDLFRPFAFLFTKVSQNCDAAAEAASQCSTQAPKLCAVGYRAVAIVANSVVSRMLFAVRRLVS